jgi:hypothetical protein
LFFAEGDSRWNVRAFWVGLIPFNERGFVHEKIAIPDDLSEEEVVFLVEYEQRPNNKQAMRHGLVTLEQNQNYEQFKKNLRRLCDEATIVKIGQKNAKNNNNNYKDAPPSPICNTTDHELMQQQTTKEMRYATSFLN